jgi:hypothetical protein
MKKRYFLALLPLVAFSLSDWQVFSIDNHVTVQVPTQPEEMDLAKVGLADKKAMMSIFNARDAEAFYQIIKVTDLGIESGPTEVTERQKFYTGVVKGLLNQQGGALLERTAFKTAAGEGIEIKYKAFDKRLGKQAIRYCRSLLAGKTSYSFNFITLDSDTTGTSGAEQRRRYFNSITVKP